jgi:hypothetical protein
LVVAVVAVYGEPVSVPNSLINREFTGKRGGKWPERSVEMLQKAFEHGGFSTSVA